MPLTDLLTESIESLLEKFCAAAQVRKIEAGDPPSALWKAIEESGFADALVPEARGGAGLGLADLFGLFLACGRHCVPVPLALTMLVRGALAEAGKELPNGPITLADTVADHGDTIVCERVPQALTSRWVLIPLGHACALLPVECAKLTRSGVYGSLDGTLEFSRLSGATEFHSATNWRAATALLFAAQMVGAMDKVLADTICYANERSQFGRSIGKFQAIQHQISVMAEQVAVARMAAQLGCAASSRTPDVLLAASAKARACEAAVTVAAVAHAVHGAIGITEEYDLQLFTRRLHEWRLAFGSETYWNRVVGEALLRDRERSCADFVRERLVPELCDDSSRA